jgi:hypothetical protein
MELACDLITAGRKIKLGFGGVRAFAILRDAPPTTDDALLTERRHSKRHAPDTDILGSDHRLALPG